MKILLVTVAGTASRFSESVGYPCLKCLYHRERIQESLLYRLLYGREEFDRYIIVGGFQYEQLAQAIAKEFGDKRERISLVRNERYEQYGSGYSLYLGLKEALAYDFEELVFAEGDLYVDAASFSRVCRASGDVITCNREAILARKAVAFYYSLDGVPHYIYDTAHGSLEIPEPFLGVYNSGQIWKFADRERLREIVEHMTDEEKQGTNLVCIQKYFGALMPEAYELVTFEQWVNCNTVQDFEAVQSMEAV